MTDTTISDGPPGIGSRIVERVAEHAVYYDFSIRVLDLALRDAKAAVALRVRNGDHSRGLLQEAIDLVHRTYCDHLLALIDAAQSNGSEATFDDLIERFMRKVSKLAELLSCLLRKGTLQNQVSVQERLNGTSAELGNRA